MKTKRFLALAASAIAGVWLPQTCSGQVNSGSNGSDGAFNPTTNIVINMADHPTGIYQYTSVNISGVAVTFIPNPNNTPVVWLVQSNVVIDGTVDVSGQGGYFASVGGVGGPGGGRGGGAGPLPSSGLGSGGGAGCVTNSGAGGSFGSAGGSPGTWADAGLVYGNTFLLPLVGGSGGGEGGLPTTSTFSGGGGGGAILIAASGSILLNGSILAAGGDGGFQYWGNSLAGGGSGGGVRLVAASFTGNGSISASGGRGGGGGGRIRIDAYENTYAGGLHGVVSQGFQPIILPGTVQSAQLIISSMAGVVVSASPTGVLSIPDAVLSAQQGNPIPVVVRCLNLPLNSQITVSVKPANASAVSTTGYNSAGTLASSTATVLINIPRGGGLIFAIAATGH